MKRENTFVEVSFPTFGSDGVVTFLNFLSHSEPIVDKRGRDKRHTIYEFNHNREWLVKQFIIHLNKIFKSDFLTYSITTKPSFNDDWELFKHLLDTHDWNFSMSDDSRAFWAGQNQFNEISSLSRKLFVEDPERYNNITYSHRDNITQWFSTLMTPGAS